MTGGGTGPSGRESRRRTSRSPSASLVVVVGELAAGPLVRLLAGSSSPLAGPAEEWFRIAVCGMPMILLVLAGNGWMRGVQLTRSPVVIVLVANAMSAVASPLLVYTFRPGPDRVGVGQPRRAGRGRLALPPRPAARGLDLTLDLPVMRAQLVLGRDLIVRAAAFQVAFIVAAGVAARMGTAQIAAHQIGLQLWLFTALAPGLLRDRGTVAGRRRPRRQRPRDRTSPGSAGGALEHRCGRRLRRPVRRGLVGAAPAVQLLAPRLAPGSPAVAVVRGDAARRRPGLRRWTAC